MTDMQRIYGIFTRPALLNEFIVSGVTVYNSMERALRCTEYPGDAMHWEIHGLYETYAPRAHVTWDSPLSSRIGHGVIIRPTAGWKLVTLDEESIDILESRIVENKDYREPPSASVAAFTAAYPTEADLRDGIARYRNYVGILRVRSMRTRDKVRDLERELRSLQAQLETRSSSSADRNSEEMRKFIEAEQRRQSISMATMKFAMPAPPSEDGSYDPSAAIAKLLRGDI